MSEVTKRIRVYGIVTAYDFVINNCFVSFYGVNKVIHVISSLTGDTVD